MYFDFRLIKNDFLSAQGMTEFACRDILANKFQTFTHFFWNIWALSIHELINVKRLFTNCELCNRPSVQCTVHANSHVLVLDLKLFCFQYHQNFSEPGKIFIHKTANFLPFVTINIWTISTNWAEHNIIC